MTMTCRLCGGAAAPYHRDRRRSYYRCAACAYVFTDSLPPPEDSRRRYDLHKNDVAEPGYRAFLNRLAVPLLARLKPGASGLDFGSGPGTGVSVLMREAGHHVGDYDPHYSPNPALLAGRYDFVTCTETAEHFTEPLKDWERMFSLLKPGGVLAVMTQLTDGVDFGKWHYKDDFTHVGFYAEGTLRWIAKRFGARLTVLPESVAFFDA